MCCFQERSSKSRDGHPKMNTYLNNFNDHKNENKPSNKNL